MGTDITVLVVSLAIIPAVFVILLLCLKVQGNGDTNKWPDKSTTSYDILDFISNIKKFNGHIG